MILLFNKGIIKRINKKVMKEKYLILLLIGICVGALSRFVGNNRVTDNVDILLDGECEQKMDLLLGNIRMSYTYSNRNLSDFRLTDLDGNEMMFSSLMGENKKICFKFSPKNCSSCVDFGMAYLKSILNVVPLDRVVVLITDNSRRELKTLMKTYEITLPVYSVTDDAFDGFWENENVPFFFVTDRQLRMEELFIPLKEIPEHSEDYIKIICMKYFL